MDQKKSMSEEDLTPYRLPASTHSLSSSSSTHSLSSSSSSSSSTLSSSSSFVVARRRLSSLGSVTESLDDYGLNDNLLILQNEVHLYEVIGRGSFGTVYKGEIELNHGTDIEFVAVKKINADLTDKDDRKIFLNEAKQSNLDHPCLVKLIAICAQIDCCFLVFGLEAGGSLSNYFAKNKNPDNLPWSLRLQWAIDIASGLEFLHREDVNLMHRDLKSENVLLNANQTHAKLCDFGMSATKQKHSPIILDEACGTIDYWAPELLYILLLNIQSIEKDNPYPYPYSFYSDTYAFILILWELTSFTRPFSEFKQLCAKEKINKIHNEGCRPKIMPGTIPEYAQLLTTGWDQSIMKRSSAKTIRIQLESMKKKIN
jgi:serine/threonine protein kinase